MPRDLVRDVVYLVRPGDDNEELRYSLRSLANVPHGDVWIVGHTPAWVTGVRSIETSAKPEKWANLRQSLEALCEQGPGRFWLFNDDMFVTRPVKRLPVVHLGPTRDYIKRERAAGRTERNSWFRGLVGTYEQMCQWGLPDSLAYETHCPTPWQRDELTGLLEKATCEPFLWNTAYSATSGPVGKRGVNVKVNQHDDLTDKLALIGSIPYLSTNDVSFADSPVGQHVRALFPTPCEYEADGALVAA